MHPSNSKNNHLLLDPRFIIFCTIVSAFVCAKPVSKSLLRRQAFIEKQLFLKLLGVHSSLERSDCTFIEGTGPEIFIKVIKKVPSPSKEHDKKILAPYTTPAKKLLSHMLKKFLFLNCKVLLLSEALNFQKETNNKRRTSFNEQSY